jgi:hypothetical protein
VPALLKLALFLAFLGGAGSVAGTASPAARRRRASVFVAFAVMASLGSGVAGRESWPFSTWSMDNTRMPSDFRFLQLVVVDSGGREYPIDSRAFEPVSLPDLTTWLGRARATGDRSPTVVGGWMLARVRGFHESIQTAEHSAWPALAAPGTMLISDRWVAGTSLPPPIAALRAYAVRVSLEAPPGPGSVLERVLVLEAREP